MTNNLHVTDYVHGVYQDNGREVLYRFESLHPHWPAVRSYAHELTRDVEYAVYNMMQTLSTPNYSMHLALTANGLYGEAKYRASRHGGSFDPRAYITMRREFKDMTFAVINGERPVKWRSNKRHMWCEAGHIYTVRTMTMGAEVDFRLDLPFGVSEDGLDQLITTAQWYGKNMENRLEVSEGTMYVCVATRGTNYTLKSDITKAFKEFVDTVRSKHFGAA